MNINVVAGKPEQYGCEVLVIGCFEDGCARQDLMDEFDGRLGGVLRGIFERHEFSGKPNKTKLIYTLGRLPAERLLLVGLGKRESLSPETLRQAGGAAVRAARASGLTALVSLLHQQGDGGASVGTVVEGMILGNYTFSKYQKKAEPEKQVEEVTILLDDDSSVGDVERKISTVQTICEATLFARDLVSQPANVATPSYLAEEAMELADGHGVVCRVIEREEMERMGMDALLAVAKGSGEPPKFIILEYLPNPSQPVVVLVGKGVTFDSGGISLKPREGMEKMKNDMAGAAAVMGTIRTAATLKLPVNVVGLIPAVENLPGGKAYKPSDVVTSLSGQTIEIVNTDAEGRLILCDALHYAQQYKPTAIIDVATLTGACVVALGTCATGMMGTDESLKAALANAGTATGERVWELPLWEDYGELMKSDIADMKNAGGPTAGAISAGWFLQQFVGTTPWVHLDIAGTAWEEKGRSYVPKGATGVGVRLLMEYLLTRQ